MNKREEQISINLSLLDVNLIHKVMTLLDLTWIDGNKKRRVPTVDEISRMAIYCMNQAFESENKLFSYAGFEAEVIEGIVEIKFVLTRANPLSQLLG